MTAVLLFLVPEGSAGLWQLCCCSWYIKEQRGYDSCAAVPFTWRISGVMTAVLLFLIYKGTEGLWQLCRCSCYLKEQGGYDSCAAVPITWINRGVMTAVSLFLLPEGTGGLWQLCCWSFYLKEQRGYDSCAAVPSLSDDHSTIVSVGTTWASPLEEYLGYENVNDLQHYLYSFYKIMLFIFHLNN